MHDPRPNKVAYGHAPRFLRLEDGPVRNWGVSAVLFFAMLPDLAVRRDTRIAVNCDRSWRQSRTQPLSSSVAAKGGPSTWVVMQRTYATRKPLNDYGPLGCALSGLMEAQELDPSRSAISLGD